LSRSQKAVTGRRMFVFYSIAAIVIAYPSIICCEQVASKSLESTVKAAYIYNFTKFIYWNIPLNDSAESAINIGVYGDNAISDILENYSKKKNEARPFVVKKLKMDKLDFTDCHIVFVGQLMRQQLQTLLKNLDGTDILTVSDIPEFTKQGGMVGFYIENGNVKIEINMDVVNNAKIKISAKLLEVAKITHKEK
jgi:hypothetical protein